MPIIRINLTYVALLPLMLLVEQFIGHGWRGTMHAIVRLQAAYSTINICLPSWSAETAFR